MIFILGGVVVILAFLVTLACLRVSGTVSQDEGDQ